MRGKGRRIGRALQRRSRSAAQDAVEVVVFARDAGFAERRLRSLADTLELPALGISLPLAEIYRDTDLR